MAQVRNQSAGPLVIGEVMIAPGGVEEVSGDQLDALKDHPVLAFHLKSGALQILGEGAVSPRDASARDELIADAEQLDLIVDGRWSDDTLRQKINAALEKE